MTAAIASSCTTNQFKRSGDLRVGSGILRWYPHVLGCMTGSCDTTWPDTHFHQYRCRINTATCSLQVGVLCLSAGPGAVPQPCWKGAAVDESAAEF